MHVRIILYSFCMFMLFSCAKQHEQIPKSSLTKIKPPVLKNKIDLIYPDQARSAGMEGSVELGLKISEQGEVERVVVTGSSGYDELDSAAIQYGKNLKFLPATDQEKPVKIWLSWVVNYRLLNKNDSFDAAEYIYRITNMVELAQNVTIDEKEKILKQMMNLHEQYFSYIRNNPAQNLNNQLRSILSEAVVNRWQKYWDQWPLTFVVMQDFELRFPETSLKSYAIDLQIKQLVEDLERTRKSEDSIKGEFYKEVYKYLKSEYPKTLENGRKSDLQRYLNY
jgi:TonB family protein